MANPVCPVRHSSGFFPANVCFNYLRMDATVLLPPTNNADFSENLTTSTIIFNEIIDLLLLLSVIKFCDQIDYLTYHFKIIATVVLLIDNYLTACNIFWRVILTDNLSIFHFSTFTAHTYEWLPFQRRCLREHCSFSNRWIVFP